MKRLFILTSLFDVHLFQIYYSFITVAAAYNTTTQQWNNKNEEICTEQLPSQGSQFQEDVSIGKFPLTVGRVQCIHSMRHISNENPVHGPVDRSVCLLLRKSKLKLFQLCYSPKLRG